MKKISLKKSIRSKLIAMFILVSLIPLLSIGGYQLYSSRQTIEEKIIKDGTQLTTTTTIAISNFNKQQTEKMIHLSNKYPNLSTLNKQDLINTLKTIYDSDNMSENYAFAGVDGQSVTGNGETIDMSARAYFTQTKSTLKPVISDVLTSKSTGNRIVMYTVPYLNSKGEFVGMLGSAIKVESLFSLIGNIKVEKTGYAVILSNNKIFMAHPEKDVVGKAVKDVDPVQAKSFDSNVFAKESGNFISSYKGVEKFYFFSTDPLTGWKIIINAPLKEVYAETNSLLTNSLALGITSLVLIVFITFIFSIKMSKPIVNMSSVLDKLAEGDLTNRAIKMSNDEIGKMAESANIAFESISELIGKSKAKAGLVDELAIGLATSSQQFATSASDVSSSIVQVAKGASDQASDLTKITELLENFNNYMNSMTKSLELVNQNAMNTQNLSISGSSHLKDLIDSMTSVNEASVQVVSNVNGLNNNIKQIDEIMNIINSIAEQTNLLSLNAAIEAARAGEAGRGFSVVAEEIRKLSEQSKESTNSITNIIKTIVQDTDIVSNTTKSMREKFEAQLRIVEKTSKSFEDIASTIKEAIPKVEETKNESIKVLAEKDKIIDKVKAVASVAEETSCSAQEISAAMQEMTASGEEIASNSQRLQEISGELVKASDVFKV